MPLTINLDPDDLADAIAWLDKYPKRPAVVELLLVELRRALTEGRNDGTSTQP
jgi:hypothetical protein